MSASLVGSEMCIRDRSTLDGPVRSSPLVDDAANPGPELAQRPPRNGSGRAPIKPKRKGFSGDQPRLEGDIPGKSTNELHDTTSLLKPLDN
eukprot:2043119-Alexandrium_andersonii.AAC.1